LHEFTFFESANTRVTILTHLGRSLFLVHFHEAILYIAILAMLFYMENRWVYMIGILALVGWLVLAYVSGIFSASVRQMSQLTSCAPNTSFVALAALATALIAVLMIASCGRHWMKEYSGLGKASCFRQLDLAPFDLFFWPHPLVIHHSARPERSPAAPVGRRV